MPQLPRESPLHPLGLALLRWTGTLLALSLIGSGLRGHQADFVDARLIVWLLVIAVLELFPIPTANGAVFTVTDPIKAALAMVYPMSVAVAVIAVGSMDPREFRNTLRLDRALFNRSQSAIGWGVAGIAFRAVASPAAVWPRLFLGSLVVAVVFYPMNLTAVALVTLLRDGLPIRRTARGVLLASPVGSVLGYLSFCVLGGVLAKLYVALPGGQWVLVAFTLPLLFLARLTFFHLRQAAAESARARQGEQLYRRQADQSSDERIDERMRIAASLHDDVIPVLESISLLASAHRATGDPEKGLPEIRDAVQQGLQSLRTTIAGLRRSPLGEGGLIGSLAAVIRSMADRVEVDVEIENSALDVPAEVEVAAFQVGREALVNAVQHAGAARIRLALSLGSSGSSSLRLVVSDNGGGFDLSSTPANHFGLALMRERARSVDAGLMFTSEPGATKVEFVWPRGENFSVATPLPVSKKEASAST